MAARERQSTQANRVLHCSRWSQRCEEQRGILGESRCRDQSHAYNITIITTIQYNNNDMCYVICYVLCVICYALCFTVNFIQSIIPIDSATTTPDNSCKGALITNTSKLKNKRTTTSSSIHSTLPLLLCIN